MTERSYYRIFFIMGAIALVAVFASFIGVYLLFWAFGTYGAWLYAFIAIGILTVGLTWYLYDLRKKILWLFFYQLCHESSLGKHLCRVLMKQHVLIRDFQLCCMIDRDKHEITIEILRKASSEKKTQRT